MYFFFLIFTHRVFVKSLLFVLLQSSSDIMTKRVVTEKNASCAHKKAFDGWEVRRLHFIYVMPKHQKRHSSEKNEANEAKKKKDVTATSLLEQNGAEKSLFSPSLDCFVHSIRYFSSFSRRLFTKVDNEQRKTDENSRNKKLRWNCEIRRIRAQSYAENFDSSWHSIRFVLLLGCDLGCALASDRDDDDGDYLIQNMRPLPSAVLTILLLFRTAAAAATIAELSNGFYFISPLLVMFLCFPSCLFRFVRFVRCLYASIRSLAISRRQSKEQSNERLTRWQC